MARRKDPAPSSPAKSPRVGTGRNRQPTINDIARLSAVSKKTVSRVINDSPLVQEETRARVAEVMRKFSYVPDPQARGLAFRRSFLIGLVYDNPNAEFIVNMQLGALDALRGSGYELIVHPCDRRSTGFVEGVRQFVGRQKLRGVILLPPLSEDVQLIEALQSAGCPSVSLASVDIAQATHRVVSSDRDACAALAAHLVALGHRRIGLVRGPEGHRSAHERRIGFLDALRSKGVHIDETLVVNGGYTFESGIEAGELLLSRSDRPTAIFASNDEMAAGIYQAAYHLGLRIPDDVSVVGFDDGQIASRLWPPLTTIRLPIRVMARIAATKLIQNASAAEPAADETVYVIPHLVERASARPPRPAASPPRDTPP